MKVVRQHLNSRRCEPAAAAVSVTAARPAIPDSRARKRGGRSMPTPEAKRLRRFGVSLYYDAIISNLCGRGFPQINKARIVYKESLQCHRLHRLRVPENEGNGEQVPELAE